MYENRCCEAKDKVIHSKNSKVLNNQATFFTLDVFCIFSLFRLHLHRGFSWMVKSFLFPPYTLNDTKHNTLLY